MPSPVLKRKSELSLSLSQAAKDLLRVIYQKQHQNGNIEKKDKGTAKITVNEIISKMSFFYEKIRNAVDYHDDHLLRKNAIERILKRLFMTGHNKEEEMARVLLVELIRAGYLPNNSLPETKIEETAQIIKKFMKLKKFISAAGKNEKDELKKWIINLEATNIEENLSDQKIREVVGRQMYEIINNNIIDNGKDENFSRDKRIQIYLAIYRLLFKYDREMLKYVLFRYFNPNWNKAKDEDIALISQHYNELRRVSEEQIDHPFRRQTQKIASRYTVFFTVLQDAIEEDPEGAYEKIKNNPEQFRKLIEKHCQKRYRESSRKLRRAAVRSIIYIFLTKSILAFLLEVPAILYLGDVIKYYSLAINIAFPPFLLFLIAVITSVPGKENTKEIQKGIEQIIFQEKRESNPEKLQYPAKRSLFANIVFGVLYFITFLFSFGFIIWALGVIHFNIVSIIIFLFFLSLISFFGIRIGKFAKAYSVVEKRENIFSFIGNFFYVPIINMGKWLSESFSQINVFVFILDFLIEAPFKIFVEIAEQWTAYVKERKEGMVE